MTRVGRSRAASAAGLLVLLLLGALVSPTPARAQGFDAGPEPEVRLVVTSMSGVVGPGVNGADDDGEADDLNLRLLVENEGEVDVNDLLVVVQVHDRVEGARSVLAQALDDGIIATPQQTFERVGVRNGGVVAPGDIAGVEVSVDGDAIGWSGTNDVYPVQISVFFGANELDKVVTAAVHLENPPENPLQTSVVWPLAAPTTRTPAGRYEEAVPDELAPGGRLDVLLSALEGRPDAPVLLAPETETIEELADRADGFTLVDGTRVATDDPAATNAQRLLQRIRTLVETLPLAPVVGPYGRAHVAALVGTGGEVAPLAPLAMETARTRAQALLGRAPHGEIHLSTTPLTPDALGVTAPGTHLLLPADQVQGEDLVEDLDVGYGRQLVPTDSAPQRVATIADPRVGRVVTDPPVEAGPAVVRQRMVAETALLQLTRPSVAGRTLLVYPPVHWDPARGTAASMLTALVDSPWLELTDPSTAAPGRITETDLSTRSAVLPSAIATELTSALGQVDALRAAMPDELPDLDGQTVADLDDALLRALTPEALEGAGAPALARIREVREVTDDAFGAVSLADNTGVTLTSDTGEVPITLERTRGSAIDLVVEVDSGAGLLWDEGGQRKEVTLPEGASRTVAFSARAAARGTFRVTVSVWDPTERKMLDSATISVRSTEISRTALAIIGGVVVLLLALGARRRRSPTLEVVR